MEGSGAGDERDETPNHPPVVPGPGGPEGRFRRRIRITATPGGRVEAELADDFHHFGLVLTHDGDRVVSIEGRAARFPWTECAGAVGPLAEIAGAPLDDRSTSLREHADPHANCTHLFDLAGLAIAHAAAGRQRRVYDVTVPDRDPGWRTRPVLDRDGERILTWEVEGTTIASPALFEGVELRGGFLRWAERHLEPDRAEAAFVLRRGCEIAMGRHTDWDALPNAAAVGDFMLGVCHTFQPGRAETAVRVKGSTRDFSDDPAGPLPS